MIYVGGTTQQALALKITPYGDTLWLRIIENFSISGAYCGIATDDGGCVITGDGIANFAVRLNSNGSIRWTKFYNSSSKNNDIKRTTDGGFVFCGNNGNFTAYVTKIDSSGNLIWEKPFPSGFDRSFFSIINAEDSGFIVSGTVSETELDSGKALIMKIDNSGVIRWEKRYTIKGQGATILASDVLDSSYLFGGTSSDITLNSDGSTFICKTDINGNLTYSKIIYTPEQEYFYDIKKINRDKYVMAVRIDQNSQVYDNAKLYIINSTGGAIYEKIFFNNRFSAFRSVLPLSNGDILAAGIFEFGPAFRQRDIYAVRTDSMLNSLPLSINNESTLIHGNYKVFQNYPNPFNPVTTIDYLVIKPAIISLKVYNVQGKEISILVNKFLSVGNYKVEFLGESFLSGIYFYQLLVNGVLIETKKMILIK
ncbi:MAG: T9SS type A sorting domain-containing protein [Ignavibacteria bacterium]